MLTSAAVGHAVIPRDVACCEVTVNLPSFDASANSRGSYYDSVFVVDDLVEHPDLKHRAYVTEYPHGRYYAGVPITTPAGVNIGVYCILDDKPRKGISDQDLVFLRDMSQTVMTHLQTIRALSEREQNNNMVAGLGEFVRGAPDLHLEEHAQQQEPTEGTKVPLNYHSRDFKVASRVQATIPDAFTTQATVPTPALPDTLHAAVYNSSSERTLRKHDDATRHSPLASASGSQAEGCTPSDDSMETSSQHSFQSQSFMDPHIPNRSKSKDRRSSVRSVETNSQNTYQRATEILCTSLRVDGVAFVDLAVDTFGGLIPAEGSTEESSLTSEQSQEGKPAADMKACNILGCAESLTNGPADPAARKPAKMLTEAFVRRLIYRNPGGKIWTFGEDLLTHDEDGFSTDNESADSDAAIEPPISVTQERKSARKQRRNDGETLQLAFPGARCIALRGMWDYNRRRWSVAGLYWTFDPLRVLSLETDMHFVAAFHDIVVGERSRLQVIAADSAKSDFISSVSHELRSPLHGILGSVEILQTEELNHAISTLVEQVASCGHSLLEIIDHLLDFAELKQQRLAKGAVKSSKIGRKFLPSAADISADDLLALKTGVALDDLTEDAVVSSVYSFFYNHDPEKAVKTTVILDIENRSDSTAYRCQLATGGWKRIIINLVTNALKYTAAGFVRVSLKRKSKSGIRRKFEAVLSVTDSGKGMSKNFQQNHLFQDFAQEDTISSGLGLGLHMVHRMVRAMGGTVNVISDQKGAGTRVKVIVPLDYQPDAAVPAEKSSALLFKAFSETVTVGIVTTEPKPPMTHNDRLTATGWTMAIASIGRNLTYLGIRPEKCLWKEKSAFGLNIVLDVDLETCLELVHSTNREGRHARFPAMLVICHNSPSAQEFRRAWAHNPLNARLAVDFIALPCGVKQMARAISYVLELQRELAAPASALAQSIMPEDTTQSAEAVASDANFIEDAPLETPTAPEALKGNLVKADVPSGTLEDVISPARQPSSSSSADLSERNGEILRILPERPLPVHRSSTADTITPNTAQASSNPILLLVDDNEINLRLLVAFAKKHKYPYTTALDGKLALEAFENSHRESLSPTKPKTDGSAAHAVRPPNIILMDINMPVMDGYEAAQRIRAYETKHRMVPAKIFAITALMSEAAQTEAFGSGFDMFLSKPIKLKSLAKLVSEG